MPEIGLTHFPAHHSLKIGIKLLGLPQIHHVVYGLCGKIVFDPLLPVLFPLDFGLLVACFQFCVAFEKTRKGRTNFTCDLCQIRPGFLQVLVNADAALYAFICPFTQGKRSYWINGCSADLASSGIGT